MEDTQRARWLWEEVQAVLVAELEREVGVLCSGDLRAIEARVQPLLRRVGGALVGGLARLRLADLAGVVPRCPDCDGPVRYVAARPRSLVGLVGDLTVSRPYYHCGACRQGMAPLDEVWGIGGGSLTPELARVACRDGIEASFEQGADLVFENLGVRLESEVVRGIGEAMGRLVEADQQAREQWALDPAAVPAVLVVELDGVQVHARVAWREMRAGRVAPLGPGLVVDQESGEPHLALGRSTYCAGLEEADRFWPRAMREVWRAGWGRGVRTVVLLGDGADWIWRQGRTQLRRPGVEVVEILDFYHACEHLGTVAKAVFGAGSLRASDWLDRHCHLLRHQGSHPLRRALAKLHPTTAAGAEELRKARGYFRTHAARTNYPLFRARQFPIGSGAVESTVKNLMQQRQVQAGMRWTVAGAQHLANLRALHRSGRWNAFWASAPQRRLRTLEPHQHHVQAPQAAPPSPRDTPVAPLPPADQPDAPPLHVPSATPTTAPPAPPPTPGRSRCHTAAKPWAKGKDYWRRTPVVHARSA